MQQPPPLPQLNPYAAPVARVDDVDVGDLVLADRGTRLLAVIVDGLIVAGLGILGAILLPIIAEESQALMALAASVFVAALLAVLIVNLVLLHRNGQTIGKRVLGIKVLRVDGSRCELLRIIFARWLPVTLIGAIPLLGPLVSLTDALMIFRTDHRCLHDLFANTIVVKV